MPAHLLLEAKCHHSEDAPNTINKAFGQLLKEANKSKAKRTQREHCVGLLIPIDGATWLKGNQKPKHQGSGLDYYRRGFQRIDPVIFSGFGRLVNAGYVLAFSVQEQYLLVFAWDAFHADGPPLGRLEERR